MLKMVVLAPTPRASVRTATIVNVGFLTRMRQTIANILKQSPHEDAPLGQYHGIRGMRISPLGAHQLGSFPPVLDFTPSSLSSEARRNHQGGSSPCSLERVGC